MEHHSCHGLDWLGGWWAGGLDGWMVGWLDD